VRLRVLLPIGSELLAHRVEQVLQLVVRHPEAFYPACHFLRRVGRRSVRETHRHRSP
jgi:hypothetical protein